jgi:hypothetical protein
MRTFSAVRSEAKLTVGILVISVVFSFLSIVIFPN